MTTRAAGAPMTHQYKGGAKEPPRPGMPPGFPGAALHYQPPQGVYQAPSSVPAGPYHTGYAPRPTGYGVQPAGVPPPGHHLPPPSAAPQRHGPPPAGPSTAWGHAGQPMGPGGGPPPAFHPHQPHQPRPGPLVHHPHHQHPPPHSHHAPSGPHPGYAPVHAPLRPTMSSPPPQYSHHHHQHQTPQYPQQHQPQHHPQHQPQQHHVYPPQGLPVPGIQAGPNAYPAHRPPHLPQPTGPPPSHMLHPQHPQQPYAPGPAPQHMPPHIPGVIRPPPGGPPAGLVPAPVQGQLQHAGVKRPAPPQGWPGPGPATAAAPVGAAPATNGQPQGGGNRSGGSSIKVMRPHMAAPSQDAHRPRPGGYGQKGELKSPRQAAERPAKKSKREREFDAALQAAAGPVVVRAPATEEERREVEKWKEERRRHYPTSANMQRKASEDSARQAAGALDPHKQERLARLREVLALQKSLGVDHIAGTTDLLPSHGLQSLDRSAGRSGAGQDQSAPAGEQPQEEGRQVAGGIATKYQWIRNGYVPPVPPAKPAQSEAGDWAASRQGGGHGQQHQQQQQQQGPPEYRPRARRPALLEKLLEKDIRRDRSWLLQAFRFLVRNDFLQPLAPSSGQPAAGSTDAGGQLLQGAVSEAAGGVQQQQGGSEPGGVGDQQDEGGALVRVIDWPPEPVHDQSLADTLPVVPEDDEEEAEEEAEEAGEGLHHTLAEVHVEPVEEGEQKEAGDEGEVLQEGEADEVELEAVGGGLGDGIVHGDEGAPLDTH